MKKIINPWKGMKGYNCFGCAPNNDAGVKMEFYEDGNEVISIWKPQPQFQGWIDTLHGGIQAVLLDEICAWVVLRKLQTTGVTSKMETRYMKPVNTNDSYIVLKASIKERKRNIVFVEAAIEALPVKIGFIRHIFVGLNTNSAEKWDICLDSEFDTLADVNAYAVHPDHVAAAGLLKEVKADRACVDYEL